MLSVVDILSPDAVLGRLIEHLKPVLKVLDVLGADILAEAVFLKPRVEECVHGKHFHNRSGYLSPILLVFS